MSVAARKSEMVADPVASGVSAEPYRPDDRAVWESKLPRYYCTLPADEDEYALFTLGARLEAVRPCFVVEAGARLPVQARRERGGRKARGAGCEVARSPDFRAFWRDILEPCLEERRGAKPVHSADEIDLLARRFPDNIQLWLCRSGDAVLAGAVVYVWAGVAHLQYSAGTPDGRRRGAADLLFGELLAGERLPYRCFSLGTSQDPGSGELDSGLVEWKESLGARAVSHLTYRIELHGEP